MPSITDLDTPAKLWALRKSCKDSRSRLEILWKLGLAFYRGRQYTYYSPSQKKITQVPTDDSRPNSKTRLVSNQIKPAAHKLVALLTKMRPAFAATPGNGDPSSIKAGRLAESASEYWWDALGMPAKMRRVLIWARVAGQGYISVTWDPYAGKAFSYLAHPETNAPVPSEHVDAYKQELTASGLNPDDHMRTSYQGDMALTVENPLNVILDPTVEAFEDCRFCMIDKHLDPDEVFTRWGVRIEADSQIVDADLGVQTSDLDRNEKTVVVCTWLYIRPCPTLPAGRIVVFTKDRILEDNKWNFPFDTLPLVKFGSYAIPNSPYDAGEVEDAIAVQKELNKKLSQIITHADQTINPKWKIPRGSVQAFSLSDEAIYYSSVNGLAPEPVQHQPLPQYMAEILKDLNGRINAFFMLNDVSGGAPAGGDNAGISLELQQEASTDSIAPLIDANEDSISHLLQMCLSFARERYTVERLMPITGSNGRPQIVAFQGSRMPDNVLIKTEAASSLPRTKAGRLQRFLLLNQMGLIPKGTEHRYLDMPDLKGWKQQAMLDEDQAEREHDMIKQGIPINPVAMQEAQGALQGPMNPETQQPWQDDAEKQGFLLKAMVKPRPYEDFAAHFATHTTYMKSAEYETLPVPVQHEFEQHVEQTVSAMISLAQAQNMAAKMVPPRISLQARETLPPTAVSEILQTGGVAVTPAVLATEEPMESMFMTTVSDSVDKPNAPGETLKNAPKSGSSDKKSVSA